MKRSSLLGLVPLALYLGAFTLVPVVSTLVLSFHTPEGHWGLGAFRALAAHYQFGEAVVNTLAITGLGLLIELSLGLASCALKRIVCASDRYHTRSALAPLTLSATRFRSAKPVWRSPSA